MTLVASEKKPYDKTEDETGHHSREIRRSRGKLEIVLAINAKLKQDRRTSRTLNIHVEDKVPAGKEVRETKERRTFGPC